MTKFSRLFMLFVLTALCVFAVTGCGASFTASTPDDLADPEADLYLYGVEKSGGNWYLKVLEEYEDAPTDGFLYLPVAEDVYAEFQDPECVGAWSPEQYLSAGDLASGCKKGSVQEGAQCFYIAEDGIITELYEENYYADANVDGSVEENPDVRILVAYFSRTGNTAPLAEYAAEILNADLYEIVPKEEYTDGDIDYSDIGSRTSIEQKDTSVRPEINGAVEDMDRYDIVVLAYPIWWGQAPRIIDTFVESYDFCGKTMTAFCTSASSDIGTSDDWLMELAGDGVYWLEGTRFVAGTSKEEVEAWLQEIGLS